MPRPANGVGNPPGGGVPLGPRSARLADLRRLVERRSHRDDTGRFVVDGPVLVAESLGTGLVEAVFIDADALGSVPRLASVVEAARAGGVEVWAVTAGVLARIADPVTPQPIVAVLRRPPVAPPGQIGIVDGDILVCDGVTDPGNLGTLLRVAEASGMAGVWVVGAGTDPFGPKAVRASAGSVLRVPVTVEPDAGRAVAALAAAGHRVVGLRGDGTPYDAAILTPPVAIVVGSEAHGISAEVAQSVAEWVGIPMSGSVESLNAGVAGAVVATEVARRRRTGSGATGDAR